MKIKFDSSHNAVQPAFILTTRSGCQIGAVPAYNIDFKDKLNSYKELTFTVYKYDNGVRNDIWYKIDNFKLCYCPDWNMYFQMTVEINENDCTAKNISCISLGEAELSQIMIYNTEINTENDILRDDYKSTVLWKEGSPNESLLNRIMEKAPHYKIKFVDESISSIQRTFSFDNISVYDALQEIAQEIGCLFIIKTLKTEDKDIERSIWVYDLESSCNDCGNRGEFVNTCSKCGSNNIKQGYGKDTTIFCSADNLAEDINYSVDTDNVKNCFKLEAGDDLMTAAVINCNPTGTAYMYYFNPEFKEDMSKELSAALDEYTEKTSYYQSKHKFNLDGNIVSSYNALIDKYHSMNEELRKIDAVIAGYPSLMNAVYSAINTDMYLNSGMMPKTDLPETSAANEAEKLNALNSQSISVMDLNIAAETSVTNTALSYARFITDNRYKVTIKNKSYSGGKWRGSFKVESYSDEKDTADSNTVTLSVNDNYQSFVEHKIDMLLNKSADDASGITALFKLNDNRFKEQLKKYCLVILNSFYESCQACIDILIGQGVGDPTLWEGKNPNLYEVMYLPYLKKLSCIQSEIQIRKDEIAVVQGKFNKDGKLEKEGMQTILEKERDKVQAVLDFKTAVGDELWEEFCSYRRESTYKNENYISDGLNDSELFKRALEFLENAQKEIYKSASLQHKISTNLKNLLVIKEFSPITNYFEVGNWIRIKVDNKIYKLRLIEYEVNFDDLDHINVDFSDAVDAADGISDLESILKQATSVSSSYNNVAKQAEEAHQSVKHINEWVDKGLNVTNQKIVNSADNQTQVWDRHGMLFREYDEISDDYSNDQIKIINCTLAMTNDGWQSVKTAVGKYYFFDPDDEYKLKAAYGVIAETIVGKMILGEQLGIYADNGSMSFTNNGLNITNGVNTFNVNPNSANLMTISNNDRELFRFDENGQLYISGDGSALDIEANSSIEGLHSRITQTSDEIKLEVEDKERDLYSEISQTAGELTSEITRIKSEGQQLSTRVTQTEERISTEVTRASNQEGELAAKITANADEIKLLVSRTDEQGNAFSSFTQKYDSFKSKVVTTDSSGNFIGSQIEQNSDYIRLSWNKCSKYIQFENGEMNIYSSSTHSTNNLLAKFNEKGIGFYYQGKYVGKIGTNKMSDDDTSRGLVFDLDGDEDSENNDYMCWASKKKGENSYTIKLAYYRADDLLRADCPFKFQSKVTFNGNVAFKNSSIDGSSIKDDSISADKISGTIGTAKIANGAITSSKIPDHELLAIHMSNTYSCRNISLIDANGEKITLNFLNGILCSIT